MIREAFAGRRVLLTGVTGFLGTGLLERLLTDTDVGRIDAVARGDAAARLESIVRDGQAFGPARERLGTDQLLARYREKVRPVAADLSVEAPAVAEDLDLVIHAAATVSFEAPVDEAFATNLGGSVRLYEAAHPRPFIHVSTAYVAGITRGTQPEERLERDVDWRAERAGAQRMHAEVVQESRRPEALERFEAQARARMGRAGPQSIAVRAEELRGEWVVQRLVRAGRARARSLGWPDVYAFTKALTERALDELAGDAPLAIVRPSIIESAHRNPYPGWIEGFRVAEPIILAFGRGALPEFPGIPEGVLDLIPVDMVVNAVLAVAAQGFPEKRAYYHVSSGNRNPLRFRRIYEICRDYYLEHPLPERGRGAYRVPTWNFPGKRAIEKRIRLAERVIDAADRVAGRLPRGAPSRDVVRRVDRARGRLDFVKRYASLYGAYVEAEVIYTDDRAKELYGSLPEADRRDFCFDPTVFTWERFLPDVHLPAITAPMRWAAAMPRRPDPEVVVQPAASTNGSTPSLVLAVFDIEGTMVSSNVVEAYLWLRLSEADGVERARTLASVATRIPGFLAAERRDRGEFLRLFYRQYAGGRADEVRALARATLGELFLRRLSPAAVRRIRRHRDAGHRIVFITGSLDFVVEPLRSLADIVVAARLREVGGRFIGDMEKPPLVGEARASWIRDYARAHGADLPSSYAYADSMSDLPMLEAVGNAVAINPDVSLARLARRRRWPIEDWTAGRGAPRIMLPDGPIVGARDAARVVSREAVRAR